MNILVIVPTPFFADRGSHFRILEEALVLEKKGHQITILTYHIGRELPKSLNTKIKVCRIWPYLFWYNKLEAGPNWQKVVLNIFLIWKTLRYAFFGGYDVIYAHLHEGALIGWIVKKILFWKKMKFIADFHGTLVGEMLSHDYLKGGFLRKIFKAVEGFIYRLGDVAFASSDELRQIIKKETGRDVEVLLDGVSFNLIQENPDKKAIRAEFGLPSDKIIVLYTGSFIENKGVNYLINSIPELVNKYENLHFVIAGSPLDQLDKYLILKDYAKNVTIISPLNYFDAPRIQQSADIALDPKDSGVGQASGKILQYMAAGLPVVCFDRKNNHDYLGENAAYVDLNAHLTLSTGIEYYLNNEKLRNIHGQLNQRNVKRFSWDKSMEKVETYISK